MHLLRLMFAAAMAACLAAPAPAAAQEAPTSTSTPAHRDLLTSLASTDYRQRQDATRQLLADSALQPEMIVSLYAQATTPEQRHRLRSVALHHLLRQMRMDLIGDRGAASIGIRLEGAQTIDQDPALEAPRTPNHASGNNAPARSVVRVGRTFPGFPGFVYLQPGDLILAIQGQSLPADLSPPQATLHFIEQVQRIRAGQTLHLTLERQGQVLDVRFRLAGLDALKQIYEPDSMQLVLLPPFREKWADLRQRLDALDPAPTPLLPTP